MITEPRPEALARLAVFGIPAPTPPTLKKHGLTLEDYADRVEEQSGACAICGRTRLPLCIDHHHFPGWKNMPAWLRKLFVRCLACRHCNHRLLGRWVTPKLAARVAEVLGKYEQRQNMPREFRCRFGHVNAMTPWEVMDGCPTCAIAALNELRDIAP